MIPYLFCIIPVSFICLFSSKTYAGKKRSIALLLLPLFLLIALRGGGTGADTSSYIRTFLIMARSPLEFEVNYERLEVGFKVLLRILTSLSNNPQILFVVQAIVCYFAFIIFISKNTFRPAMFVVLFLGLNLYNFYLSGVRQAFAMAICLIAFEMAKERKLIWFLILIMLAATFHKSALFFLVIYPLSGGKINKNYIILDIAIIGIAILFNEKLFAFGGGLFDIEYGIEIAQNGYVMVIIVAIVTAFSFLCYDRLVYNNPHVASLIQINTISMAMWAMRLYSRTAERVALYFLPFTILLMIELFDLPTEGRYRKVLNLGIVAFFSVYFLYKLNSLGLIPYNFFWTCGGVKL